ncbi:MAG TPA: hypothetical protein VFE74_08215 [Ramlibacter sp.]|jgi:hypothetical protein|nr:hypothetical protein [Ramlibacter sp.]
MGIFALLRGKKPASRAKPHSKAPASTEFAASQLSVQGVVVSTHSIRKDLLKLVLRETLMRAGIPQAWLTADLLRTTSSRREQGIHVRFLVRHWEPRLMLHGVALEREFLQRIVMLDPLSVDWLMGFSWQFAMEDTSACPPLPHPGSWTAVPSVPHSAPVPETRPGDIIAGPVLIPQPVDEVKADLERLLALRDEDMKRHGLSGDPFAPTRPATL